VTEAILAARMEGAMRGAVVLICLGLAGCAAPQRYDPVAMDQPPDPLDMQSQILRERMADRERDRRLTQQERDYDRAACIKSGLRGPDVEQCVRDAAARRRVPPPGQSGAAPPGISCSTIDMSGGLHDTICD
jgi:hypothetical protein